MCASAWIRGATSSNTSQASNFLPLQEVCLYEEMLIAPDENNICMKQLTDLL